MQDQIVCDFGPGDSRYKNEFCNIKEEEATVLLFKKTLPNMLIVILYKTYKKLYNALTKMLIKEKMKAVLTRWLKTA